MTKAAKHLTPVALELGSKCPCIVDWLDSNRDSQVAVNRIIGAKWSTCSGQACIAIDYLLVEEEFAPILVCPQYMTSSALVCYYVTAPDNNACLFP